MESLKPGYVRCRLPGVTEIVDPEIFDWARDGKEKHTRSPEAEIMDWADDITYAIHDMIDFYCAGLIPLHLLAEHTSELGKREWRDFFKHACERNDKVAQYFPVGFAKLLKEDSGKTPAARWAADYVAGLTERQVKDLYRKVAAHF
jgi:dGTP triphosphohydrolase